MTAPTIRDRYFCAYDGKRVFVPDLRKPSTKQYCSEKCRELHEAYTKKHNRHAV